MPSRPPPLLKYTEGDQIPVTSRPFLAKVAGRLWPGCALFVPCRAVSVTSTPALAKSWPLTLAGYVALTRAPAPTHPLTPSTLARARALSYLGCPPPSLARALAAITLCCTAAYVA